MRILDNQQLIHLHGLVRFYCSANGIQYKAFARDVASSGPNDTADSIFNSVDKFISHGTLSSIKGSQNLIVGKLKSDFEKNASTPESLNSAFNSFFQDHQYLENPKAAQFFNSEEFQNSIAKPLRYKSKQMSNTDASQEASLSPNTLIGQSFSQLSAMFNLDARDVLPVDKRFLNSNFICVRRSSESNDRYVCHGLKFEQFDGLPNLTFFSEKYSITGNDNLLKSRTSSGLAFLDGNYLYGLARPSTSSMTTVVARITTEDTIDYCKGHIHTSNRKGTRISASALLLRCKSVNEKHQRTGTFSEKDLLAHTPESQNILVHDWIKELGNSLPLKL